MVYGYARCSTNETKQDIERQIKELKQAGAELVFSEFEHSNTSNKRELNKLLNVVTIGDTVITSEVSRLSRSTKQLCELIELVKEKKIKLQILNSITIDCSRGTLDPMTAAFIQIAGVFAELELSMIRERVKSGMANARAKGKIIGRPVITTDDIPQLFYKHYAQYKADKMNISELARICNMSRTTVYKYIKMLEE